MKIAQSIYTPFQKGHLWPLLTVSCNFRKKQFHKKKLKLDKWMKKSPPTSSSQYQQLQETNFSQENSWNQLNNWGNNHP